MNFEHPWVLLAVFLPLAWAAWEWPGSQRRAALLLKAAAFVTIALALAGPRLIVFERRVAVAVLADTSASIPPQDLLAESALADKLDRNRGGNWVRVIPFARATRLAATEEHLKDHWDLRHTAGVGGHATNLEGAIRDGIGSLPPGMVPRLLVVSDGNENLGSVSRAIWQAQRLGIPIDTLALPGRPKPGLLLESIGFPAQVFSGERFPIEVTIASPRDAEATVEITAEGKSIGTNRVALAGGENHLHLEASVNSTGAIALSGKITAQGLGEAHFEDAITLRSPRALLVSHDPESSEEHLVHTLEANQFAVERAPDGIPPELADYQLVVINNWNLESIPEIRQAALEDFVKQGGGLLWIAGEHDVYVEKKGDESALERTLPAKLAPPRTPEGTAVVLIIDKSSSMEGRKIELARYAAIGVVDNLRPIDTVGVLIFDNSFQWAVPLRRADDRAAIQRMISGITPDGGTQIAPALTEAYQRIVPVQAIYKHIVLMTDGISEEGDSMALARQAVANHVTISTVGLGQDVNRGFLEKVASSAEGKSYFLNDPAGLEQLLLRDVQEHTGNTAVEKSIHPKIAKEAEVLEGVGMDTAPALRGYIRFQSRPSADTILEVDKDPLFVRWQYGLGRAAVFTSDAKNRWAINWITWPGFDRFWANVGRDLLPHSPQTETSADFDRAANEVVVDYRLSSAVEEPAEIPAIYALGPGGFQAPVQVSKIAAGHYHGRMPIGQNQGLFRIRPVADSRVFPEIGFYRQEDEMLEYGNDQPLLQRIASATGGHFNPGAQSFFDSGGRSIRTTMDLWPGLLVLAVLLNLAELLLRKWQGLAEALHLGRPATAEA